MKKLNCAFCRGKGRDPFNLLSQLAICQVCGGKGKVEVNEPVVECAFCKGTGVHLHSRMTCTACGGKGVTAFRGAKEECFNCGGTGGKDVPCSVCGGKGFVRKGD